MASKCKCKKTECEECPEWIFTFADLVMLMMGFFVILWVLKPPAGKKGESSAQQQAADEKWITTIGEVRRAFGYTPDPHSNDPVDKRMLQKEAGPRDGAENNRKREAAVGTDHKSNAIRPGNHIVVGSHLLFDRGLATLTPETTRALDEIAEKLRGHNAIVVAKGHASLDDLPDTSTPQQRMDLSLRRAQAAQDYLIGKGVLPESLRVQGCSTFEPVHQRVYNSAGQSENRRVEIEWTSQLVDERQDHTNLPTAPLSEIPAAETDKMEKSDKPADASAKAE